MCLLIHTSFLSKMRLKMLSLIKPQQKQQTFQILPNKTDKSYAKVLCLQAQYANDIETIEKTLKNVDNSVDFVVLPEGWLKLKLNTDENDGNATQCVIKALERENMDEFKLLQKIAKEKHVYVRLFF